MSRLALFTDLDDTLFGTTKAHQQATERIIALLQTNNIPLFAVTGRSFDMIENPAPFTGLACEVGTQIYLKNKVGSFRLDKTYNHYVQNISDFKYTAIHVLCEKLLLNIQEKFPKINLQFQPLIQKYKISFTFTTTVRKSFIIQHYFQNYFKKAHYPTIQVILSAATSSQTKTTNYNLDVLATGKETAVAYLAEKYHYQPIVAGDGGNDITMLLKTPWPAIIVGGYKPELAKALQLYLKQSHSKKIYVESHARRRGSTSLLYGLRLMLSE